MLTLYSPFILFDNRDEDFSRPTANAEWWPEHPSIYAPRDLLKAEKGTWIGASRNGRVAVLVNKFQTSKEIQCSQAKTSRGALPKEFLLSQLSPSDWVKEIKANHFEDLNRCGEFTLLVASVDSTTLDVDAKFLSNCDHNIESLGPNISMALSNGIYGDKTWTKIDAAEQAFKKSSYDSTNELIATGFSILSTSYTPPPRCREELRKSIFIPQVELSEERGIYGTRSQTAIIFDGTNVTYAERDMTKGGIEKVEQFQIKKQS